MTGTPTDGTTSWTYGSTSCHRLGIHVRSAPKASGACPACRHASGARASFNASPRRTNRSTMLVADDEAHADEHRFPRWPLTAFRAREPGKVMKFLSASRPGRYGRSSFAGTVRQRSSKMVMRTAARWTPAELARRSFDKASPDMLNRKTRIRRRKQTHTGTRSMPGVAGVAPEAATSRWTLWGSSWPWQCASILEARRSSPPRQSPSRSSTALHGEVRMAPGRTLRSRA